ncbi:MAG: hypothetical protein ONB23_07270 [candidate division KSB1 bacterium]|nr:hypothetical protein [candidate division KSB1 bacterium]
MPRSTIVCGILVGGLCVAAQAQSRLGGYVKFYHHNRFEGTSEMARTGTRLQLTAQQSFAQKAALFGSLDFDVNETEGRGQFFRHRGASVEVYPVELYVDLYSPYADVRLGKQFIFWGKAEWINPTDNINPWDYANMSAEIEDYRLPVTAARLDLYLGPTTLELVTVPVFLPHRIPGLEERELQIPNGPTVVWKSPQLPPARLSQAELAVRLMGRVAGADLSLSYYRGHDHSPSYRKAFWFSASQSRIELAPFFPSLNVIGGDLQKVFGQWGIRAEGAYFRTEDRDGRDVLLPNPHATVVTGLDYTPSEQLGLTLQLSLDRRFRYVESWERAQRETLGLEGAPPRNTYALSGRFRWKPADYWDSQTIFVWNRPTGDRFVLAFVSHQPVDALSLTIGGVFFGGPSDTPFGRMRDQDRLFLEVKASF